MTTHTVTTAEIAARRTPPAGGFNLTALGLEIRRLLRNRRTVIFTMITPTVFFLLFGLNHAYATQSDGAGSHGNVSADILISMSLYGAVIATTAGGAMIAIERSQGWSRQLRITPLSPMAYIAMKVMTAMVLSAVSVAVVNIVGALTGTPSMPLYVWASSAASVWVGSLLFAAFGLFMGYLLPTENVMQIMGFVLMLLSFGGGLFIPLSTYPHLLQVLAKYTPLYGLNQLAHALIRGTSFDGWWALNVVAWLAIFVGGAVWRFRGDTARV
ncbi:MAG TPA: ABC transporter permease [Streptosporangiaceae bacterium]|nr:ABC transporter permease [Streptosporangiaceae bacterium]